MEIISTFKRKKLMELIKCHELLSGVGHLQMDITQFSSETLMYQIIYIYIYNIYLSNQLQENKYIL